MTFFSHDPTAGTGRRLALALGVLLTASAQLAPAADDDLARYLGVKTCAGSNCHGAGDDGDSRVLQNEFQTWHRQDKHARAYQVLLEERGRRIATNLGLASAAEAPECLRCHATYVPDERRGKRFSIADGVACESCHGAASTWLGEHVTGEASRAENIANGMYPTEDPVKRATLCLSCHLGGDDSFVNHRLLGAGHPRLSFELDTFTRIQPAHYRVDADYRARKQVAPAAQVWAVGQVMSARRLFQIFVGGEHPGSGVFPEFAFFDCHACHHPFTAPRWQPRQSMSLPPGTPHLNDANVLMLHALALHIEPALATRLAAALGAVHAASQRSMAETVAAARDLDGALEALETRIGATTFEADDITAVLRNVIAAGSAGDYGDYAAAEQATMAVAALSDGLSEVSSAAGAPDDARRAALAERVQALYAATEDQNAFEPRAFAATLETVRNALD